MATTRPTRAEAASLTVSAWPRPCAAPVTATTGPRPRSRRLREPVLGETVLGAVASAATPGTGAARRWEPWRPAASPPPVVAARPLWRPRASRLPTGRPRPGGRPPGSAVGEPGVLIAHRGLLPDNVADVDPSILPERGRR